LERLMPNDSSIARRTFGMIRPRPTSSDYRAAQKNVLFAGLQLERIFGLVVFNRDAHLVIVKEPLIAFGKEEHDAADFCANGRIGAWRIPHNAKRIVVMLCA